MRRSLTITLAAFSNLVLAVVPSFAQSPDGIYLMTRMWTNSLETNVFYFGPGVAVNAPNYDIAVHGTEHAIQQDPGMVGELSVSSDTMRVDWMDGEVTEDSLQPSSGGCFYWDGGLFCPVDSFETKSLTGKFSGGAAIGGGTSAFASFGRTILFQSDGTYAMGSTTSIDSIAGGVDASAVGEQVETGQYTVGANSIDFFPEGANSWSTASFPYHDDSAGGEFPNRIYFDGVMMTRQ